VFSVLQCVANVIVLITLHWEENKVLLSDFYKASQFSIQVAVYVLLSICILLESAFIIFVLQLIFLHQWLIKHDLTTYDYILYLREKANNPNKKLDILQMKGNRKSKVIKKIEKDPETTVIHIAEQKNDKNNIVIPNKQSITFMQKM